MDNIINSLIEERKNLEADKRDKKKYQRQKKPWMNYFPRGQKLIDLCIQK
jgi:hypothetical protein